MEKKITRRNFLWKTAERGAKVSVLLSASSLWRCSGKRATRDFRKAWQDRLASLEPLRRTLSVAEGGEDPKALTLAALDKLGGMKAFVHAGDIVVVKPNISWARSPQFAATTNPRVVATVVEECLKAGAREVKLFDRPNNRAEDSYRLSEIPAEAEKAGAQILTVPENRPAKFEEVSFPIMGSWPVFREALLADLFINVPIAKHHNLTELTLGIKNLMGILGGERGSLHVNIDKNLAGLAKEIRPHLTVMDATHILVNKGPIGGSLRDVKKVGKVIAGADVVATDAFTATLFTPFRGITPEGVNHIQAAAEMQAGDADLSRLEILKTKVS